MSQTFGANCSFFGPRASQFLMNVKYDVSIFVSLFVHIFCQALRVYNNGHFLLYFFLYDYKLISAKIMTNVKQWSLLNKLRLNIILLIE